MLSTLAFPSDRHSRAITPENPDGAVGGGAKATEGAASRAAEFIPVPWKINPYRVLAPGEEATLGHIREPGQINHIWMTTPKAAWRSSVLRMFWDGAAEPAVEVPLGDFFGQGWGEFAPLASSAIAANPHGGFNSYWPMPFASEARITLENLGDEEFPCYWQIDYEVGGDAGVGGLYFHAQWRRSRFTEPFVEHVLLDGIEGRGHYVGTYCAWQSNSSGWWGEGEVKFFLDSDEEFPTICGTGTEDYFGGAFNFDVPGHGYTTYSTPYLGLHQVIRPDGEYRSQQRFGMYRWHVTDPVRFTSRLRATVQALGWRGDWRYQGLRDDVATTASFYLDRPTANRPEAPTAEAMECL